MIKTLRIKIALAIILIPGIFILSAFCILSVYSTTQTKHMVYESLNFALEENREMPGNQPIKPDKNERKFDQITEICVVKYNFESGETTVLSDNYYIDSETLLSAIKEVTSKREFEGEIKEYDLIYSCRKNDMEANIAFTDKSYISGPATKTWGSNMAISAITIAILAVVSIFLSKIITQPVEKSIEEQKRFIADASHELKTPLSVISANNNILIKNDSKNEWLESNKEEIAHMKEIIEEMLTLAKGETITKIEKLPVNFSRLAKTICLEFDTVAFEKNIALEYDIADEIFVDANEKMIKQIFMILIDNAIKYEISGGKIEIKLYKLNSKTVFDVKNFNSFISSDDLPHIFERFYRADKSRSSSGVGLGLAIAKNIAELHSAELKAISSKTDGTTFRLII